MTEDIVSSTHPPLPPTTEDERLYRLRLLRSRRVGIATYYRLMAEHKTARAAFEALPEIARQAGIDDYTPCPEPVALAELRSGRDAGARLIWRGSPEWPIGLDDLSDPPPMLWCVGDMALMQRPAIAMVGARSASSLGLRMARKLASDLSEQGFVIVSGLARGIDAAAHTASLQGGTIAVLAGGVDIIYPAENTQIFNDIGQKGLRLSEQPIGLQPQARHFPVRNRIIAGLARSVIIIEAALKSGSLITADAALSLGREVGAVPGHPFDGRAGGCNALLRDGATLIRTAEDVLSIVQAHPVSAPPPAPKPARSTGLPQRGFQETAALHQQILSCLGPSPVPEDQLTRDLGLPTHLIAPALVELELDGQILRQAGGLLALCV